MWLLAFFLSLNCQALTVSVLDQKGATLFEAETRSTGATVGAITIDVLEQYEVPYTGGVYGITSMFGHGQDLEVISDTEMKAFGWCFRVDGRTPMTLANETPVPPRVGRIEWFYAYARYVSGTWSQPCLTSP